MPAITQPITFQIFNRTPRNAGVYETNTAQIPTGVFTVTLLDTNPDAFCSDPANAFVVETQVSADGGLTWDTILREEWTGGTHVDKRTGLTVPNHMESSVLIPLNFVGRLIRAVLTLTERLSVGIAARVNPIPA